MLDIKSLTGAYTMTSLVRNRISESKDIFNCVNYERIIRPEVFPAIVGMLTERVCSK